MTPVDVVTFDESFRVLEGSRFPAREADAILNEKIAKHVFGVENAKVGGYGDWPDYCNDLGAAMSILVRLSLESAPKLYWSQLDLAWCCEMQGENGKYAQVCSTNICKAIAKAALRFKGERVDLPLMQLGNPGIHDWHW